MPTRLKRFEWMVALFAMAGGAALWHRVASSESSEVAKAAQAPLENVAKAEREIGAAPPAKIESPAESAEQPAAAPLRELCGQPWVADFTRECLEALERRYGESAVADASSRYGFRPSLLGERVTWHQVLEKPAQALAAVREAVARPECLVPDGRFRIDLRQTCAADDMARLAILRRECTLLERYDDLDARQGLWDVNMRVVDRAEDHAEYHGRLKRLDDRWFGELWRHGKCQPLAEETFAALGPFPEPIRDWHTPNDQYEMMEAAARLGSDWALSSVLWSGTDSHMLSDEEVAKVRRRRPVLAELLDARRNAGVERGGHILAAVLLGDVLGVALQPEGVQAMSKGLRLEDWRAAWPLAARRVIGMGWRLVVDGAAVEWRFEAPEDVRGDEPWFDWSAEGLLRLEASAETPT